MNYFSKNLKTLRAKHGLSQDQFARTFGLSKSNINSYEQGALPRVENFLQMMDYFKLDPSKFMKLDMELHSVRRLVNTNDEQRSEEEFSEMVDSWLRIEVTDDARMESLEKLSDKEIRELYINQYNAKQQLLKENLELREKYEKLQEKYAALLEASSQPNQPKKQE